ncbi:glycosyltransferase [Litorihabitans aurantiacus]|uniref:Dolichol monophosphate mannose synthase n=1 Tax=Litorihabitans aurantiacus TaxID=1930061 RepID=A0AA37XAS7_9MICO|nr:glycosyltransferase family 2 protein [Litorihabitans aurantiacus]GMA30419.1 dolichol monophosphate mannose synthase [Litorihabitans aurantiacus]
MSSAATVIVPTFNEGPNVAELVRRLAASVPEGSEILFVDDSTDTTPETIREVAAASAVEVRLIHRTEAVGGLSGAVVEGLRAAQHRWCVVMDGDLQHPPELVPVLLETGRETAADVVVASRRAPGGSSEGLADARRRLVSSASIALTRAMFPRRLRDCTDPMTGFFALDRTRIDLAGLRPEGFKILLEILARQSLVVVEEPFVFGERFAGESKATLSQGVRFVRQVARLRFGRMPAFALIGALGAVANLAIMAGLIALGSSYVVAAIAAAVLTIVGNFVLQEAFVFRDLRHEGRSVARRFATSFAFNASEAALRLPVLVLLVEAARIPSVLAQAATLVVAFLARFVFHSRVVYRPRRTRPASPLVRAGEGTTAELPVPREARAG